ncbi:hypothetical protein [Austwickia chelonae]|uniref:hypothetical protein n=1 Tax=Austwickia chelonae TaxID=100225 RepID=UPI000E276748|nr:hypothetical protein [Austwickia chelonae]
MSSRKTGDRVITSALIAAGISFLSVYSVLIGRGLWSAFVLFLCAWPAVYLMMAVGDDISHTLNYHFRRRPRGPR